jgi:acyl-CoA thioester hydrolase
MKIYKTQVRVRYAETDAAEIVYYSNFFIYFEVGKMEMFRELNLPYDRRLPMVEAHCDFKNTAKFDDILEIHTTVPEVYDNGFKVASKIYRTDDGNQTLIAEGYTKHLTADLERKVQNLPNEFLTAFSQQPIDNEK